MSFALKKQSYPYISSDPGIASGAPIIAGTRITIRTIARYYQMGMNVDEILNTLTHLTPSQVHSALAYYFDNQDEIESDIDSNSDINYWRKQALTHSGLKNDGL
ncbi:DUF433 domain-containing protein [Desulfobacterium sp. N47]|uniref:DUF433 domain-containing protein n=1 Tax=uncultured Desulfobacterium sp. TaxID=201089 RepID=E1YJM9_9BACT|nr:hypothetical protein N47_E49950 [uncultured Desulfobacterium sp.]